MDNAGRQTQEIIESDPLATAVCDFVERQRRWEGTATELYAALTGPYARTRTVPEHWPKSPRSLGKRLTALQATLADVGITVWKSPSDGRSRRITLAVGSAKQTLETLETLEANAGAASAPNVSSRPIPANVGETLGRKPNAGAVSNMNNVSNNTLHDSTALPQQPAKPDNEFGRAYIKRQAYEARVARAAAKRVARSGTLH
jgi:hypothetical protein